MNFEDFVIDLIIIIGGILIVALAVLGIYVTIADINKNKNDYQKCICEKVD